MFIRILAWSGKTVVMSKHETTPLRNVWKMPTPFFWSNIDISKTRLISIESQAKKVDIVVVTVVVVVVVVVVVL